MHHWGRGSGAARANWGGRIISPLELQRRRNGYRRRERLVPGRLDTYLPLQIILFAVLEPFVDFAVWVTRRPVHLPRQAIPRPTPTIAPCRHISFSCSLHDPLHRIRPTAWLVALFYLSPLHRTCFTTHAPPSYPPCRRPRSQSTFSPTFCRGASFNARQTSGSGHAQPRAAGASEPSPTQKRSGRFLVGRVAGLSKMHACAVRAPGTTCSRSPTGATVDICWRR